MSRRSFGISGIALDVPPYRVDLKSWCRWTGNPWEKVRQVVGHGFRIMGPGQSVYTMAANAVIRLIRQYDVDPSQVRFLALGTESSTDNSAGAVIVKGIVNKGLDALGLPNIARHCEVPEFKHACLGGIYGVRGALRYLSLDGQGSKAIVVCTDVALYPQGSSGEPTQGAGAVAMLLEESPCLAEIDLVNSGPASDYRAIDFRKPLKRPGKPDACTDLPVYNGRYSTNCYVDEILHALEDMYRRRELSDPVGYLRGLEAVFMHRPYRRMPETGWAMASLGAMARCENGGKSELAAYCKAAGVETDTVIEELVRRPDLERFSVRSHIGEDAFPATQATLKAYRNSDNYARDIVARMELGSDAMMELGNIYTGALPAWLAAGFEEAWQKGRALADRELLLVGYGSGDAADALPARVTGDWEQAAARIGFQDSMKGSIDLTQDQYLAMRDSDRDVGPAYQPAGEFVVDRIGKMDSSGFQDLGIEYYRYVA